MPGIAGIIAKGGVDPADVQRMTRCMMHERSYTSGMYANNDLGVCVGWVSHGGSYWDCMPLWNEHHNVCLIFSGEDFTTAEQIHQRGLRGGEFETEKAGYLISLYEATGLQFLEKLNGWFSGLLIDLTKNLAVLFNDRYGLGRVYYYEGREQFYFSTEAKSLLEILPRLRRLDLRGVAETFRCGSVLQDRTFFPDIALLPCGSRWSFNSNTRIKKEKYFCPKNWEQQGTLDKVDFIRQLGETFARVVPRYLGRATSVAMSLTGGLDGRMIMAWANAPPETLPCYTFGGAYRASADVNIARHIAVLCGQHHRTVTVGADFLTEFPTLAEKVVRISDGTMDVSGAVELYANREARQIAPVRLTGNYGSEIVRGNVAFRPMAVAEGLLEAEFAHSVRAAGETYHNERNGHPLSFIAFKQVPWHHYSRLAVEQSQLTLRSPYLDNDLVALMYQAPPELLISSGLFSRLIHEGNHLLTKLPTDRGLVHADTAVIAKMRRLWAEFTVKMEYAYDYGMPQWLVRVDRQLASLHFERIFLGRHKFYHFRVWYRDQLSQYIKDVLLDPRSLQRDYVKGQTLERMVNEHTSGRENWTHEIHRLLTLELLQRQLIERR